MTLLQASGLSKAFGGVVAADDVSFAVDEGELVAIIGPNGAGKSTTFNMVGGQLRPDAGTVHLAGEDITGLPPRAIWRRGVGRTFQIARAFASMSVRENVQMAMISHARRLRSPWTPATRLFRDEADEVLALVGMADQAKRPCAVLAYGDLKRVELAVALANRPRLLLMDEPTAGMAPRDRADLMALAANIVRDRNTAVLFTEHDMDVVFGHADRVLVLHRGRIIAEGSAEAVRANEEVRAIYLGGAVTPRPAPPEGQGERP